MPEAVPLIYCGPAAEPQLAIPWRAFSLAISLACLTVFVVAAKLTPSPSGVSTHQGLGLAPCQFLERTGIPCISCGMTTSFSHFVRGNIAASLWVQPMGTVLAVLCAMTFWTALYIAITGKPIARLLRMIPPRYYIAPLMTLAVLAWAWKIFIHLHGMDGWR